MLRMVLFVGLTVSGFVSLMSPGTVLTNSERVWQGRERKEECPVQGPSQVGAGG